MNIVSIKPETGEGQRRIELSDGSLFSFRICYLPPEISPDTAAEGIEISAEEEAAFRFASACLRTEKAALRLIAHAEQCTLGLTRKLEKRGHETACINTVLSRLIELKLIDDHRFARLWLESRIRLARSPRRLLSSLAGRGVDREAAEAALKTVFDEETELAMLTRYAKKQLRRAADQGSGGHSRMQTYPLKYLLKSEGFSPQAIKNFLDVE